MNYYIFNLKGTAPYSNSKVKQEIKCQTLQKIYQVLELKTPVFRHHHYELGCQFQFTSCIYIHLHSFPPSKNEFSPYTNVQVLVKLYELSSCLSPLFLRSYWSLCQPLTSLTGTLHNDSLLILKTLLPLLSENCNIL